MSTGLQPKTAAGEGGPQMGCKQLANHSRHKSWSIRSAHPPLALRRCPPSRWHSSTHWLPCFRACRDLCRLGNVIP